MELPHLQKLNERFADRGVTFVSVASTGPSKRATQILEESGITYKTFYDQKVFEDYRIAGIPTTVIIDHTGRAMYKHVGFSEGDEEVMARELELLLGWIEEA